MELQDHNFFSVSVDLILKGEALPYDLYINSSASTKEKFVRVFPAGGVIDEKDLEKFKRKYHQIYILESQRGVYLKSLVAADNIKDVEKVNVIKDTAIQYLDTLFDSDKEFTTEVLNEAIEGCRDSVESMVDMIQNYDIKSLQEMIAELSFHDFYTYDHSINVSMYCIAIYKAYKPDATRKEIVESGLGGLLHDLGKIKIPTHIINNPGKLSDEEFDQIKKHPGFGVELMEEQQKEYNYDVDINTIARAIHEHHENYNGTGYPQKLKGEDIHVIARITAIADFFDAITTKRSYHEVLSTNDALKVMEGTCGKKIDPSLFEIFKKTVYSIKEKDDSKDMPDDILGDEVNKTVPDDFDPCQPHEKLPLKVSRLKSEKDYGKIKFVAEKDPEAANAPNLKKNKKAS